MIYGYSQHQGFLQCSLGGKSRRDTEGLMVMDPSRLTQLQRASSGHLPSATCLAQPTVQPGLGSSVSERGDPGPGDRLLPWD